MERLILNVKKREKGELLEKGLIPGVFYGREEKSTPISLLEADFMKAWKEAGESSIISLSGAGKDIDAVIQDVQFHPVTDRVLHADFYVIEKDRKIKVDVPLQFIGESPAEKNGLILVKVMHEIEIESLPADLPHQIEVDLARIVDIRSQILVEDLNFPEGVKPSAEKDEVVLSVTEAREEEPETPPEEVDMESIEVMKKGKEEAGDETPEDKTSEKKNE